MSRISVLIADADAWTALPVAHCLKASGRVTVHGFSATTATPSRYSSLFTTYHCLGETFHRDLWLDQIGRTIKKHGIDIVMPTADFAIRTLSEQRERLGWTAKLVQLPDVGTFDTATNKASLAGFLASNGFPQPPSAVVTAGRPADNSLSSLTFPVLVKPPLSNDGKGIRRVENRGDFDAFLASRPDGEPWVVQTLIEGHDLGVSVLCGDGEVIASAEQHALVPSREAFKPAVGIEFGYESSATDLVKKLMRELGWSGVANIDLRIASDSDIPLILEVNGRYWSTLLGSLKAGVNFPLLACETALGEVRSNRIARRARYFAGAHSILMSVSGGGADRIRPGETSLYQLLRDPVPPASRLLSRLLSASPLSRLPIAKVGVPPIIR